MDRYSLEGKGTYRRVVLCTSTIREDGRRSLDAFSIDAWYETNAFDIFKKEVFAYGVPWVALVVYEYPDSGETRYEKLWGSKEFFGTERPTIEPYASLWNSFFTED